MNFSNNNNKSLTLISLVNIVTEGNKFEKISCCYYYWVGKFTTHLKELCDNKQMAFILFRIPTAYHTHVVCKLHVA